jgi:hypothetical protein
MNCSLRLHFAVPPRYTLQNTAQKITVTGLDNCFFIILLGTIYEKNFTTHQQLSYIFQQGVMWTTVFNKFLNNGARIILSVLSVLYVSPEDGVKSH